MNHELSPLDRAARNLFAAISGVTDPATIDIAMTNPFVIEMTYDHAARFLTGPFGTFDIVDDAADEDEHVVKSPNHQEGYEEGLVESLNRTLHVINEFPELSLAALGEILEEVRDELIADEDDDSDEEGSTDPILALLQSVFGPNVQIISLEQTAR